MTEAYLLAASQAYKYERHLKHADDWQTTVITRTPHEKQALFIESKAKRKIIRAGRRGGKTVGIAIYAVRQFLAGRRVLYATPTQEQVDAFWFEIKLALEQAITSGALYKNETLHLIEVKRTKNRIRAKTAWNADTLRGDYADDLILDEYQLMSEDTLGRVGYPMLLQNNGNLALIYTPPSLHSRSATKAKDPRHTSKLFRQAASDQTGLWETFHFTSYDNPHNSREGVALMAQGMTHLAYEQEIMAEDKDDVAGALWTHSLIDDLRVARYPTLKRVVIGVDPTGSQHNEAGIVAAGMAHNGHVYVLSDNSLLGSPKAWSNEVIATYKRNRADRVVGEKNYGGDMVEHTIRTATDGENISYKNVNASRGKALRAEPIAALYEQGKAHHVGTFEALEDEMCSWLPDIGMSSPNRMDALVWAITELLDGASDEMTIEDQPDWLAYSRG